METFHINVELPPSILDAEIHWAITEHNYVLATGVRKAVTKRTEFDVAVNQTQDQLQYAQLHACINNGPFISYRPSFGDVFQRIALNSTNTTLSTEAWQIYTPTAEQSIITVYYHRFDGDYDNISLWTWDELHIQTPEQNELIPVGRGEFGVVFQIDSGLYDTLEGRIGFLPRKNFSWSFKVCMIILRIF